MFLNNINKTRRLWLFRVETTTNYIVYSLMFGHFLLLCQGLNISLLRTHQEHALNNSISHIFGSVRTFSGNNHIHQIIIISINYILQLTV